MCQAMNSAIIGEERAPQCHVLPGRRKKKEREGQGKEDAADDAYGCFRGGGDGLKSGERERIQVFRTDAEWTKK